MKLASRSLVPPGTFRFRHPISGHEEAFHAWGLLRSWVTAHCEANSYPPVSDDEIEAQICERLGPATAERLCEGSGLSVNGVSLHWKELMGGTAVLASHLLGGRRVVEQEEAERRAGICVVCPRNSIFSKPCGGNCPELDDVVKGVVGGGTTTRDADLHACSVCLCLNRAQVWVPIATLAVGTDADFIEKAPEPCWKRAGLLALQEKS